MSGWPRYLTVVGIALFLAGCGVRQHPAPVDDVHGGGEQPPHTAPGAHLPPPVTAPGTSEVPAIPSIPQQPGPIEHVEGSEGASTPSPAKNRHYSWETAAAPLVAQMLRAQGVNGNSVLLVDSVNNRTNGSLSTADATNALVHALANNGKLTLVSAQQLAQAKKQLGLSPEDSLGTRNKAIGLARAVSANYVLYSSATGNVQSPTLKMQLMLVQTGEIIWSGRGGVTQTH